MSNEPLREVALERVAQDAKWGEAMEMLLGTLTRIREEAIQVAAVAVAFIEAIDRARLAEQDG